MLISVRLTPRGALEPVEHFVSLADAADLLAQLRTRPRDANGAINVTVRDEKGPADYAIDERESKGLTLDLITQYGPKLAAELSAQLSAVRRTQRALSEQIELAANLCEDTIDAIFSPGAERTRAKPKPTEARPKRAAKGK